MLIIKTAQTTLAEPHAAVAQLHTQLSNQGLMEPNYLMVQLSATCDLEGIRSALSQQWPDSQLHIATSCLGSMTATGAFLGPEPAVCVFAIADPDGDYATCAMDAADDAAAAASEALRAALAAADRFGESPELIWLSATPGIEESVISGLQKVVGEAVPIVGGSAADNAIAGDWRVSDGERIVSNGLLVSVFFPSVRVAAAFHSGYTPTDKIATITKGSGRTIEELDGQPAAQTYAGWTQGAVTVPESDCTNILMQSSLFPIGREFESLAGLPVHLLAHPETIAANGKMTLFANVQTGEQWTLMTGTEDALIARSLSVALSACHAREINPADIAGMILVFCAGCMLTVRPRIDEIRASLVKGLPDVPFITAFTFGEQGPVLTGINQHGNLMISAVVFSKSTQA